MALSCRSRQVRRAMGDVAGPVGRPELGKLGLVQVLVDALNVIHGIPRLRELLEGRGLAAAELFLIELCARWCALTPGADLVLVFDGARPEGAPIAPPTPGLTTRYVPDADADLLDLLARAGTHRLVSDDGDLAARALDVESPRHWFESLEDTLRAGAEIRAKSRPLSDAEVEEWKAAFGEPPPPPPPAPGGLGPEEVKEWLEYFEGPPDP